MIKFLRAAFNITWFQILIILLFTALKYILIKFELSDFIIMPFLIVSSASFLMLLIALGIMGIIENKGQSFKTWEENNKVSKKNLVLMTFINWAQIIPVILFYLFACYLFAPTSLEFFIALLCGIVLRNCIDFFLSKNKSLGQETQPPVS